MSRILSTLVGITLSCTIATAGDLADLSLEDLAVIRAETVTGVSRYEQDSRRAPASSTLLTSEDFADFGWRTVADGLRSVLGLNIRNDRFYETIGFRGFSRAGDYNSRVLVLVDGQRVNDIVYQQGSVGFESPVDPSMIERVEVIRGPASSVYGTSAFFGVINIVTRSPRNLQGGELATSVEAPMGYGLRATAGRREAGGWEWLASASVRESDGEDDLPIRPGSSQSPGVGSTVDDGDGERVIRGRALIRNGIWFVEGVAVQRTKEVPPWLFGTHGLDVAEAMDERAWVAAGFARNEDQDLVIEGRLSVDHYRYRGEFAFWDDAAAESAFVHPSARGSWLHAELRALRRWEAGHVVSAGVEHTETLVQKLGRSTVFGGTRTPDLEVDTKDRVTGVFAQGELSLGSNLLFNAGLRHDNYRVFGGSTTPRAALIWNPYDGGTWKLLYGKAFRVPNVDERFAQPVQFKANRDLAPERVSTWETVYTHALTKDWVLEGSLFRFEARDLISLRTDPSDGLFFYDNTDTVRSEGAALQVIGEPLPKWRLRAGYTWQHTRDLDTDLRPQDAPEHLARLNLSLPAPLQMPLRAGYEFQYTSGRRDPLGGRVPASLLHHLSVRTQDRNSSWEARVTVRNLFDAEEVDPVADGVIDLPGRVILVEFMTRF